MRIPLLLAVPLAACSFQSGASEPGVPGTGTGSARTFAVDGFTAVALRGSDDVDVRAGTGFSVRAVGPSAELDTLAIARVGDTLRIGRKNGGFGWSGGSHRDVKVHVTLPRVTAASIAGSGNMTIDRVEGQAFEAADAGSGDLNIAILAAQQAKFSLAGSGSVQVVGKVDRLTVSLAGSGDFTAPGLKASSAKVSLAGSGDVRADVTGPASVSSAGSGDIDLGTGARCSTSKVGSGAVHCGG